MTKKTPVGMTASDQKLTEIVSDTNKLLIKGIKEVFEKRTEKTFGEIKKQSDTFKAYKKTIDSLSENVFNTSSRKDALQNKKLLDRINNNIEKSTSITEEEKKALITVHQELTSVNKTLKTKDYSLGKTIAESFKSQLPSIAGVLGAVGLNNPAFMFVGGAIQNMVDRRREIAERQKELSEDHHLELIRNQLKNAEFMGDEVKKAAKNASENAEDQEEESLEANISTNEILKDHSGKLDYIGSLLDVMVSGGEADKFKKMEAEREKLRADERLVEAVENITATSNVDSKKEELGFFSKFAGIIGALTGVTFAGVIGSISGLLVGLASFLPVVGAVLATGFAAYKAFKGAFEGWGNAAAKLGKETATLTDKLASAAGGFLGGVFGIIDMFTGWFGIDTKIGPWMDQTMTKVLASTFDFFKNFGDNITKMYDDVMNWMKEKIKETIEAIKHPIDTAKKMAAAGKETLGNIKESFTSGPPSGSKTNDAIAAGINKPAGAISDKIKPIAEFKGKTVAGTDSNDARILKGLKDLGYNDDHALGILANIKRESSGDPSAVGDSGKAYGLAQWHPDRQKNFEKMMGKSIKGSSIEEQLQFMDWELKNTERGAGRRLEKTESAGEAAAAISRWYERPSDKEGEMAKRARMAEQLAKNPPSNTALINEDKAEYMKKENIAREKSQGAAAVINAPKSTRVNQMSNTSNTYQSPPSVRNYDPSLGLVFSY